MPEANVIRLQAVIKLFQLTISEVARAANVSRPYVSRILSGSLRPSSKFLRALEASLGTLVERWNSQLFEMFGTKRTAHRASSEE